MFLRSYFRPCFIVCVSLFGLLPGGVARADVDACIQGAERGQVERDAGKLQKASASFLACADEACPQVIRLDCAKWKADVDKLMPSIVPRAKDDKGADISQFTLTIDGEVVEQAETGRAILLDPGPHILRWTHDGQKPFEQKIVVRTGEKNRFVDAVFRGAASAGAESGGWPGSKLSVWTWPFAAVAVGGFVGLAAMGSMAKNRHDELSAPVDEGGCAPNCTDDQVGEVRGLMIGANVSLGVGLAATGGALFFALSSTLGTDESASAAPPAVAVSPRQGGAVVAWQGRF